MKLNNCMYDIKCTSHKRYLIGRLCSIKTKKTHRPKYISSFVTLFKSKRLANLQK